MNPRPYQSPARTAAAERTRKRIVAAAAKLLRSKGAGDFSLDAVGKLAKVTRLTVYNQFGTRRALLEAVFDDRAARGGLFRLGEAMGERDPHLALDRLIAIFCDFWSFDQVGLNRLHRMGTSDAEFDESIRERNERRRGAISVFINRMVERGEVNAKAAASTTDLLFVLTSFPTFFELTQNGRTKEEACTLLQTAVRGLIKQAKGSVGT